MNISKWLNFVKIKDSAVCIFNPILIHIYLQVTKKIQIKTSVYPYFNLKCVCGAVAEQIAERPLTEIEIPFFPTFQ